MLRNRMRLKLREIGYVEMRGADVRQVVDHIDVRLQMARVDVRLANPEGSATKVACGH